MRGLPVSRGQGPAGMPVLQGAWLRTAMDTPAVTRAADCAGRTPASPRCRLANGSALPTRRGGWATPGPKPAARTHLSTAPPLSGVPAHDAAGQSARPREPWPASRLSPPQAEGIHPNSPSPLSALSRRYYIRIICQEHLHLAIDMSADRAAVSPLTPGFLPVLATARPSWTGPLQRDPGADHGPARARGAASRFDESATPSLNKMCISVLRRGTQAPYPLAVGGHEPAATGGCGRAPFQRGLVARGSAAVQGQPDPSGCQRIQGPACAAPSSPGRYPARRVHPGRAVLRR